MDEIAIKSAATIRQAFPILGRTVNGKQLVYLDSAASSQKPEVVINAIDHYYRNDHSNVHRGVHTLSQIATDKFEHARETLRGFINAASKEEIIFTKGTTEGVNLVAYSLAKTYLEKGDEILLTEMEHHSNIVPWQMAAAEKGAKIMVAKILPNGELDLEDFRNKLSDKTKIVSFVHISNALGTVNPAKEITSMSKEKGALVFIDGAQAAPHLTIDVREIGCDFYAISGHKMYGPTGTGVLYGKKSVLDEMAPFEGGGEMIETVSFEKTTYNVPPFKFEAGTPNIAGAIGLEKAVDFINEIGPETIRSIERDLLAYAHDRLSEIDGIKFYGTAREKAGVVSFNIGNLHPSDIGAIIDKMGVAVRTGHHCTQPLMTLFNVPGTVRASFGVYNTREDIDVLIESLNRAVQMLS